jgi:DNA mismatch repair protein MutH
VIDPGSALGPAPDAARWIACAAPLGVSELLLRAAALEGLSLSALASAIGAAPIGSGVREKGSAGALIERALGASNGSLCGPDFPALGVELKTIPIDAQGRARESTFVCRFALRAAEELDFEASPVLAKLRHVLWIPLLMGGAEAVIGRPVAWRPTPAQLAVLRGDYDDLVGMIALGKIESIDARLGRWLQLRPKAAHGGVRTRALNEDGDTVWTMPRGFYLRARFTAALLRDPETLAGAE